MRKPRLLKIAKMGDPVLRIPVEKMKLDQSHPDLANYLEDMRVTLFHEDCVGLSGPQVYLQQAIVMYYVPKEKADSTIPEGVQLTVMFNPEWKPLSEEMVEGWEECGSVPGIKGKVPRYRFISYSYETLDGEVITGEAQDYHARVIQHECDHLQGLLYMDRMKDLSTLSFIGEDK
jgi:peptide deformylase